MAWEENLLRLRQEAGMDEIYCAWQRCYLSVESAFREYADKQPEAVNQLLYQYAESGRMMMQRLAILACMRMVFTDENKGTP